MKEILPEYGLKAEGSILVFNKQLQIKGMRL